MSHAGSRSRTEAANETAKCDGGVASSGGREFGADDEVQSDAGGDVLAAATGESEEMWSSGDGESRAATAVTATGAAKTRTGGPRRRVKSTEVAATATRPLTRAAKRRGDEQQRRSEERAIAARHGGERGQCAGCAARCYCAERRDGEAPDAN
ncbi:hypothetical protein PF008_g18227 [Phytophthora fragariae]|uniref:Uncharacterized protein n=1 Tax=Phytophthora fragariae TaxID=53985 RepID=A0A6G0R731_9STRA|nr:hypothetical protein PF008_g18227 [Phytophthora fragariae]